MPDRPDDGDDSPRLTRRRKHVWQAACGGSDTAADENQTTAPPVSAEPVAPSTNVVSETEPDEPASDDEASAATTSTTERPASTEAPSTQAPSMTAPPEDDDVFDDVLAAVGEPTARYDDESLWVCRGATPGTVFRSLDTYVGTDRASPSGASSGHSASAIRSVETHGRDGR